MGRLFWKLFLWFWASTLLTLLLTAWLIGQLVDDPRFDPEPPPWVQRSAGNLAQLVIGALEQGGEPLARRLLEKAELRLPVLVMDASGRELRGRPLPPTDKDLLTRSARAPDGSDYQVLVPLRREFGERPQRPFYSSLYRRLIGRAPERVALHFASAVLLSGLFCFALAWYLSRPVVELKRAARQVSAGDLDTRVPPSMRQRWDEFADLGREFDAMVERIAALIASQKRLLNDVSHEIRSPLARLRVAVELLRRKAGEADNRELERIEREVERLDELVGQILTLSRLESGSVEQRRDWIDLAALVEEVVADARFESVDQSHPIELTFTDQPKLLGNSELLRRALDNVLRNALRHTPVGTQVRVELATVSNPATARIQVTDKGPGLQPQQLPLLFQPFERLDGQASGYGLGLAITRRALEAHGGKAWAEIADDGGLRVVMELPIQSEK